MVFPQVSVPVGASRHVIDGTVMAHRHHFVELAVILGGRGEHCSADGVTVVEPGDLFVMSPGVWHAYTRCEACIIHNCYFGGELLERELSWLRDEQLGSTLIGRCQLTELASLQLRLDRYADYARILDELAACVQAPQQGQRIEALGLLTTALGIIAQSVVLGATPAASPKTPAHPVVAAAKRMLEEQLDAPWTLVGLAYQLHLDRSYLVRLFRQQTGLAPMAYLAQRRALAAAGLLRETDLAIGEVGARVGWPDATQFGRRFKAFFGVTASTYRNTFEAMN